MKVVPMIFNTEMVIALMNGRKTVTRRPAKGVSFSERAGYAFNGFSYGIGANLRETMNHIINRPAKAGCPANIGDLIYVRETFAALGHDDYQPVSPMCLTEIHEYRYKASEPVGLANCSDHEVRGYKWIPSIHMPRSASRLTLRITDVRIERVQDITEEECWKEGIEDTIGMFDIYELSDMAKRWGGTFEDAKSSFACLWESIYQDWDQNPYVWVAEFEVIHKNVDKVLAEVACD
ncbi:hypothetical protein [Vibrio sp. Isolate24]|uniref:hypothetical protein n=1 Tax=Vibrio sp. Isolate24 TaxID=2908534 RepID=UPI001EFCA534|nr:hypothetical protein [Vibrio sp. Isolate24]MCG9678727.1 hypothetical protein [Vibrio sp. Isolate24]